MMLTDEWPFMLDRPVLARHRKECREGGHIKGWTRNEVPVGKCPRCGENVLSPEAEKELEDLI